MSHDQLIALLQVLSNQQLHIIALQRRVAELEAQALVDNGTPLAD